MDREGTRAMYTYNTTHKPLPSSEGRGVVDIGCTVVKDVIEEVETGQLHGERGLINTQGLTYTLYDLEDGGREE